MKNCLLIFATLTFWLSIASANSSEKEIATFFDELTQALNNRDLNKIGNAWTANGEMMTLAAGIYRGPKEISDLFAEGFKGPYKNAKYDHLIQYIRLQGSTAMVDGVWKISNGPPNYPDCGVFVYNLRIQNGTWKITFGQSSVPRQGHTAEHGRQLSWVVTCAK